MKEIILVAHNLRSCHNVGSLIRTAEGLGLKKILFTGYTPYPLTEKDQRIPHEALKVHNKIAKTALGAEKHLNWQKFDNIYDCLKGFQENKYAVYAVEQTEDSAPLPDFRPPDKLVLVIGNEVTGIEQDIILQCDGVLEIPMKGLKESFNVAQAGAMAMYHCTYN